MILAMDALAGATSLDDCVTAALDVMASIVQSDYSSAALVRMDGTMAVYHPGEGWLGKGHAFFQRFDELKRAGGGCEIHPVQQAIMRSPGTTVAARSEMVRISDWRRGLYYQIVDRHFGIEDRATISFPAGNMAFVMNSGISRDFMPDELRPLRAMARLIEPCIHAHIAACSCGVRTETDGLTAREMEVMKWVAEGKRNSEIAVILGVSKHTVRKHLENSFTKLGVETRLAALRALRLDSRDRMPPDNARGQHTARNIRTSPADLFSYSLRMNLLQQHR